MTYGSALITCGMMGVSGILRRPVRSRKNQLTVRHRWLFAGSEFDQLGASIVGCDKCSLDAGLVGLDHDVDTSVSPLPLSVSTTIQLSYRRRRAAPILLSLPAQRYISDLPWEA